MPNPFGPDYSRGDSFDGEVTVFDVLLRDGRADETSFEADGIGVNIVIIAQFCRGYVECRRFADFDILMDDA